MFITVGQWHERQCASLFGPQYRQTPPQNPPPPPPNPRVKTVPELLRYCGRTGMNSGMLPISSHSGSNTNLSLNTNMPQLPSFPALMLRIVTAPLDVAVPSPLAKLNAPPVLLVLRPEKSYTLPPAPLVPLPADSIIIYRSSSTEIQRAAPTSCATVRGPDLHSAARRRGALAAHQSHQAARVHGAAARYDTHLAAGAARAAAHGNGHRAAATIYRRARAQPDLACVAVARGFKTRPTLPWCHLGNTARRTPNYRP